MPIRAILFDVYGTLLNVHSMVQQTGNELGTAAESVSRLWRQKQLEYTWVWSLRGAFRGFRELTGEALDFALAAHGVHDDALRDRLLQGYERLEPFPEVAGALKTLRSKSLRFAALSNGDPDMLEPALQAAGIRPMLEAVLSVAPLRIYKPDRRVYELGERWAGCAVGDIAFVSANAWDVGGAAAFGFHTFWINRTNQPPEYDIGRDATVVCSLEEIAGLLA